MEAFVTCETLFFVYMWKFFKRKNENLVAADLKINVSIVFLLDSLGNSSQDSELWNEVKFDEH